MTKPRGLAPLVQPPSTAIEAACAIGVCDPKSDRHVDGCARRAAALAEAAAVAAQAASAAQQPPADFAEAAARLRQTWRQRQRGLFSLPPALYVAAAAVAALAVVAYGAARYRAGDKAGADRVTSDWNAERAAAAARAASASEAARVEEQRRAAAQKEIVDAHEARARRARADADAAGAAAARLRDRVAALVAASGHPAAGDPSAAAASAPAGDATELLADVLGRCVSRVRELAAVADERGAAGAACERAYDALNPAP